jgi:hypothetical protein
MRAISFFFLGIVLLMGCKKDPLYPPCKAVLIEPTRNSECTPVETSNGNSNEVRFRWQPANHTDIYELRVTNLATNAVQTKSTMQTTETMLLQKGTPFSWTVITKNSQTDSNVSSETWSFYNPGSQTSYVPFPAEIVMPRPGATVFLDINNEIELQWSAADIDNDITGYEIYFSDETPPEVLIAAPDVNETSLKVDAVSGTVYYWKVVTKDAEGNASDTGVLDFKVF